MKNVVQRGIPWVLVTAPVAVVLGLEVGVRLGRHSARSSPYGLVTMLKRRRTKPYVIQFVTGYSTPMACTTSDIFGNVWPDEDDYPEDDYPEDDNVFE